MNTNSEELLSYLNIFKNSPIFAKAKEFNYCNAKNNYRFDWNGEPKANCGIERLKGAKMAPAPSGRDGYGCDSVVVSIGACGASGPGSNPGRGPFLKEGN